MGATSGAIGRRGLFAWGRPNLRVKGWKRREERKIGKLLNYKMFESGKFMDAGGGWGLDTFWGFTYKAMPHIPK